MQQMELRVTRLNLTALSHPGQSDADGAAQPLQGAAMVCLGRAYLRNREALLKMERDPAAG